MNPDSFFEGKPAIDIQEGEVSAVFTCYNELEKLPYFLEYHRKLGVKYFFAIDNNSTDETRKFLESQSDVTYFWTDASYARSKAGRLWTTEIAKFYCHERWMLTLDVDELFVFPFSELLSINNFCTYLDNQSSRSCFGIFLDVYSDQPLSETLYETGTNFLETCSFFDGDGYSLHSAENFPPIQVRGGPRQRLFWAEDGKGRGPSMRKLPLMKWSNGTEYLNSTHSMKPVALSEVTCTTLHFKFFSTFKDLVNSEVARNDRSQPEDYKRYLNKLSAIDPCFFDETSVKYTGSTKLIDIDYMSVSKNFIRFLKDTLADDAVKMKAVRTYLQSQNKIQNEKPELPLKSLNTLLSFFGTSNRFKLFDISKGNVFGLWERITDSGKLGVIVEVNDREVGLMQGEKINSRPSKFSRMSEENMGFFKIDRTLLSDSAVNTLRLVDHQSSELLHHVTLDSKGDPITDGNWDGVVHGVDEEGFIKGWAVDWNNKNKLSIAVFLNGEPYCELLANHFSGALRNRTDGNYVYHGFKVKFDAANLREGDALSFKVKNSNFTLRKGTYTV